MSSYGFSAKDPIRVTGFYEEKRYLESLRDERRNMPLTYERLGSCRSEHSEYPIDVYRVHMRGRLFVRTVTLYVDIYGERDWRPPKGFLLNAPAPGEGEGGKQREAAEGLFRAVCAIVKPDGDSPAEL